MSKTRPFIMTFAQTILSAISIEAASAHEAREPAVDRYQRDADLLIMNPVAGCTHSLGDYEITDTVGGQA